MQKSTLMLLKIGKSDFSFINGFSIRRSICPLYWSFLLKKSYRNVCGFFHRESRKKHSNRSWLRLWL